MVGRHARAHPDAALLGRGKEIHRRCGGDVGDVQPAAGEPRQLHVPRHHHRFRLGWCAGQPEQRGVVPLVHLPSLGQCSILRVLSDHHVKGLRVFERQAHHARRLHAVVIVGEQADPGFGHLGDVGECLSGQALGDGSGR